MNTEETDTNAASAEEALDPGNGRKTDARNDRSIRDERPRYRDGRSAASRYRRTMIGSLALGVLALIGGILVPDARQILFALAGTGLFGGLLAASLSPNDVVTATVADRLSSAAVANQLAIADAAGVEPDPVYVPSDGIVPARLILHGSVVPVRTGDELARVDESELTLEPTAGRLVREFERELRGELGATPRPLAAQLAAGLVDLFELAERVEPTAISDDSVTFTVSDSSLGDIDRFDHPIPSFLATGFAIGLERPIDLEVAPGIDEKKWLVTCRWETPYE